ncbi:sesquipedalian-1 isoform X1 [Onychomys torridus]|uniref:sesquipedalian-1 isoform X1 n=2 Tax=Onychomys torridus TaxID=38674 RepID=UPI00167F68D7|nr:sesquipedalian-1 isoform X1 [Onychomys torridus]XP_036027822.1 sesquipedalian-1 isoform X1 [Onychomys torridus]XP_036027823.1 sesquipedalian-1 isoform X1 [Onychomys torridus]
MAPELVILGVTSALVQGTSTGLPAMKLNERSLAFYATCDAPVDNAGFLHKRGGRGAGSHRRWFVLRGNMLFYFEAETSREPLGVILLEGCTVELVEAREEFAFAVRFSGGRSRPYVLAADSQAALEGWVKALSRASFHYLRLVVRELEQQLAAMREGGPANALPTSPSLVSNPRPKENGRAVWSALPEQPAAAPQRPPLPPRRRASSNGPLVSFAQLHERYGLEVRALRSQWRGGQAGPAGVEGPWHPSGSGGTQTQDQP